VLLKLALAVNDPTGRKVTTGSVVRWHKQVGAWVDYGDDVCDLHVRGAAQLAERRRVHQVREQIRVGAQRARAIADFGRPDDPSLRQDEPSLADAEAWRVPRRGRDLRHQDFVLRLTATDRGVITAIAVAEGRACSDGDLLALFSTDGADSAPAAAEQIERAPLFRTACNFVPWHEVSGSVDWWEESTETESRG
jgi:hypothetical protein